MVRYERFLALHVILIVPGTSRGFFVLVEKLAGRETFLEKGSPSPYPSPSPPLRPSIRRQEGAPKQKIPGCTGDDQNHMQGEKSFVARRGANR